MSAMEWLCEEIPADVPILNATELTARLGGARTLSGTILSDCESRLRDAMQCRYAAVRVPVIRSDVACIDVGFGTVRSRALRENLSGCEEAFLMAVTLGHGVDRLLQRLAVLSPSQCYVTDALASALTEAACDLAQSHFTSGLVCRPRFSPGYGDFPLSVQPALLASVNAGKLLGITLSETLLMSPSKSVTAIVGVIK